MEIDSDNNSATGSPEGTDYAIELLQGEVFLYKWDGENFTRRAGDPPATSLIFSYQGGATLTISAAELGNTKRLRFNTIVIAGLATDPVTGDLDFTNATADVAPAVSAGLYEYEVKLAPARLTVRNFSTIPAKPAAGKAVRAPAPGRAHGYGRRRAGGPRDVRRSRRGRARSRGTGRFVGRQAVCTFRLPATSKGKRLPRVDLDRLRGPTGREELLEDNRLAVRAPLRASLPRRRRRNRRYRLGSAPAGPAVPRRRVVSAPEARASGLRELEEHGAKRSGDHDPGRRAARADRAAQRVLDGRARAVSSTSRARSRARTSPGSTRRRTPRSRSCTRSSRRRRCLGATACC